LRRVAVRGEPSIRTYKNQRNPFLLYCMYFYFYLYLYVYLYSIPICIQKVTVHQYLSYRTATKMPTGPPTLCTIRLLASFALLCLWLWLQTADHQTRLRRLPSPLPRGVIHMCLTEGKLANHSLLHLFSLFRRTLLPLS